MESGEKKTNEAWSTSLCLPVEKFSTYSVLKSTHLLDCILTRKYELELFSIVVFHSSLMQ